MDARQRWVRGAVLVLAGAAAWVFVARPLLGPSERTWNAQIAQDAIPLIQGLRCDLALSDTEQAAFDAAWEKRRVLYDAAHLVKLGERLSAFVDFQVAEWADAKNSYLSGRLPDKPTEQALAAQAKLKEAFGPEADEMIAQFAKNVREPAYRASPKVGGGLDPDLPKYDEIYDDLVAKWLPQARAAVARLTAPAR